MGDCSNFYTQFLSIADRAALTAEAEGGNISQKKDKFTKLIYDYAIMQGIDIHYFIVVGEKGNFQASWRYPTGRSFYKEIGNLIYIAVVYNCWSTNTANYSEANSGADTAST